MISSKVLLVADRAIRDSESGNLSIINILEDIVAESFPILIPRFTVVAFLLKDKNDDSKQTIKFHLKNNDNVLGEHIIKVDFKDKNLTRAIIELGSIPFKESGFAKFVLCTEDCKHEIDNYTINLSLREEISVKTD